jgi:hypothetical protein
VSRYIRISEEYYGSEGVLKNSTTSGFAVAGNTAVRMEPNAARGSSRTTMIPIRQAGRRKLCAAHPRVGVGRPSSADLVAPLFLRSFYFFIFPVFHFQFIFLFSFNFFLKFLDLTFSIKFWNLLNFQILFNFDFCLHFKIRSFSKFIQILILFKFSNSFIFWNSFIFQNMFTFQNSSIFLFLFKFWNPFICWNSFIFWNMFTFKNLFKFQNPLKIKFVQNLKSI